MYKLQLTIVLYFHQIIILLSKCIVSEYEEWDYAKKDTHEIFPTERQRLINSYVSKDLPIVTDRFTIGSGVHTLKICRCWKSKIFPECDDTHLQHNKFNKDNVGPILIDGPTFPDEILDKYTKKTPNRANTNPTQPTLSDSEVDRNRAKYKAANQYSDLSDRSIPLITRLEWVESKSIE